MAVSSTSAYFPYETIRPQQSEIMRFIDNCLSTRTTGIIEAATGVGKTIATLSPLIEYVSDYNSQVSDEETLKIIVLGRTHSQSDRVIDEISEIVNKTGLSIASVAKRGKQSLCLLKDVKYQPASQFQAVCAAVKRNKSCTYFNNTLYQANLDFVSTLIELPVTSNDIIEASANNSCCPAEITNLLIKQADVIACAYHYLFSDDIREMFLNSLDTTLDRLILVVDEAHNLPDATIAMNSVTITESQLSNAIVELRRSKFPDTQDEHVRTQFIQITEGLKHVFEKHDDKPDTRFTSLNLLKEIEQQISLAGYMISIDKTLLVQLRSITDSIREKMVTKQFLYLDFVMEVFDKLFKLMVREDSLIMIHSGFGSNVLELKIIDPSREINNILKHAHLSILMTGTLGNPQIFRAQTGLFKQTAVLQLPSPYKQDLGVYQVKGLTSKYSERGEDMFLNYVNIIKSICNHSSVNIGLYATSYSFLEKLFDNGLDEITTPIYYANRSLNSKDTEELLNEFRSASGRQGGLLCTVMGGRSSEGTDFPGKEMEIVIIVGLPYPPKSVEQDAKYAYYQKRTKTAWNICYTTPAFRQINQAAGRAIRSLNDRALIFLLDDRIGKNKSRLTGWMKSQLQTISDTEIEPLIATYFD